MDKLVNNKYDFEQLKNKVYIKLKNSNNPKWENRYVHSLGVSRCAGELAKLNDPSLYEKAVIAGLIHDYCKFVSFEEYKNIVQKYNLNIKLDIKFIHIYHSLLAPYIIKEELGVDDQDILDAICTHQMGKPNMNMLEMIIFVSDEAEETRIGDVFLKSRKIAYNNIYKGVAFVAKANIDFLLSRNAPIYPLSLETYNFYYKYLKER